MTEIGFKDIDQYLMKNVDIPIELYESMLGQYFIGNIENLIFDESTSAWARLYNPVNSGVILHVNVWTITNTSESAFQAQVWLNATPPNSDVEIGHAIPSNLSKKPLPRAKIKLEYASYVTGEPTGGYKTFLRDLQPGTTDLKVENGKIIIGQGGNFLVFLTNLEESGLLASGRIGFGWWEERIKNKCK